MQMNQHSNNKPIVLAGRVLTPQGIEESGVLRITGDKIEAVQARASYNGKIDLDVGDQLIAPGFIDIHVHGAVGQHLMTADQDGIFQALHYHMKHGTTGLLATTTTATHETILQALQSLSKVMQKQRDEYSIEWGARVLGVHIEGPYFNPIRAGAQNRECLRLPDVDEYKKWEQQGNVRMITIAPELAGAEQLIRYIRDYSDVLISAGHTDAKYEEIEQSLAWGLSHCTHFTNAMSGFGEAEPGVFAPGAFGAGLIHDELTVELIADGIHVHPRILELIYRMKGADRIALITDAVPFCGLADGIYPKPYGDRKEIVVHEGSVRILENGCLAGSALTMNRAARTMALLGIPLEDVWTMASTVPARLIGEGHRKGAIQAGMDADLVIIDADFEVQYTLIGGLICYDRSAEVDN